jgi:hypothetical protein
MKPAISPAWTLRVTSIACKECLRFMALPTSLRILRKCGRIPNQDRFRIRSPAGGAIAVIDFAETRHVPLAALGSVYTNCLSRVWRCDVANSQFPDLPACPCERWNITNPRWGPPARCMVLLPVQIGSQPQLLVRRSSVHMPANWRSFGCRNRADLRLRELARIIAPYPTWGRIFGTAAAASAEKMCDAAETSPVPRRCLEVSPNGAQTLRHRGSVLPWVHGQPTDRSDQLRAACQRLI